MDDAEDRSVATDVLVVAVPSPAAPGHDTLHVSTVQNTKALTCQCQAADSTCGLHDLQIPDALLPGLRCSIKPSIQDGP